MLLGEYLEYYVNNIVVSSKLSAFDTVHSIIVLILTLITTRHAVCASLLGSAARCAGDGSRRESRSWEDFRGTGQMKDVRKAELAGIDLSITCASTASVSSYLPKASLQPTH